MTSWEDILSNEIEKPYFKALGKKVSESRKGTEVYPPTDNIFKAFELTPFDKIKIVIVGQDPYHGPNQAQGLAFSVPKSLPLPPSLYNIFKEIESDLGIVNNTGDLTYWANQGVFLLNSTLTVEKGNPNSHANYGWQTFTDRVIESIGNKRNNVVFLLWGSFAKKKSKYIDVAKNKILTSTHPSPLSAHRGFLGCKHFSKANEYLLSKELSPIDWRVK